MALTFVLLGFRCDRASFAIGYRPKLTSAIPITAMAIKASVCKSTIVQAAAKVTAKRRKKVDRRAVASSSETHGEVATSLIEVLVFELAAALTATLRARWSAPPPSYCCSAP